MPMPTLTRPQQSIQTMNDTLLALWSEILHLRDEVSPASSHSLYLASRAIDKAQEHLIEAMYPPK